MRNASPTRPVIRDDPPTSFRCIETSNEAGNRQPPGFGGVSTSECACVERSCVCEVARLGDGAARSGTARAPGRSRAGVGAARRCPPRPRFDPGVGWGKRGCPSLRTVDSPRRADAPGSQQRVKCVGTGPRRIQPHPLRDFFATRRAGDAERGILSLDYLYLVRRFCFQESSYYLILSKD